MSANAVFTLWARSFLYNLNSHSETAQVVGNIRRKIQDESLYLTASGDEIYDSSPSISYRSISTAPLSAQSMRINTTTSSRKKTSIIERIK